jgi:hypothetical protein
MAHNDYQRQSICDDSFVFSDKVEATDNTQNITSVLVGTTFPTATFPNDGVYRALSGNIATINLSNNGCRNALFQIYTTGCDMLLEHVGTVTTNNINISMLMQYQINGGGWITPTSPTVGVKVNIAQGRTLVRLAPAQVFWGNQSSAIFEFVSIPVGGPSITFDVRKAIAFLPGSGSTDIMRNNWRLSSGSFNIRVLRVSQ